MSPRRTMPLVAAFLLVAGLTAVGSVAAAADVGPAIHAYYCCGQAIVGSGFTPNASVDLTILESEGGLELYSGSALTDDQGGFDVNPESIGVRLEPGLHVTVFDAATAVMKEHTLIDMTIDFVDPVTDTVRGSGPPGAPVFVNWQWWDWTGIEVDASGHWTADFGALGHDITWGSEVEVSIGDPDGDMTGAEQAPPAIQAYYCCGSSIGGAGFTPNASVDVSILEGGMERWSGSAPTNRTGNFGVDPWSIGVEVVPGLRVVVFDPATSVTKDHTLIDMGIDFVDPDSDTVYGSAPPGATVLASWGWFETEADTSGHWSIDYGALGTDITWSGGAEASVRDDDADSTGMEQEPPAFGWNVSSGSVAGHGFARNASVDVVVRDAPAGAILFEATMHTDATGYFWDYGPADLAPGAEVTVTDGTATKVLDLEALSIDAADLGEDTLAGTAPAGAGVWVQVGTDSEGWFDRWVTADETGSWSADFTGVLDIKAETELYATVFDQERDRTSVSRAAVPPEPPTPDFTADLTDDWIGGKWFPGDQEVTVTILDPEGSELFSGEARRYDDNGVPSFWIERWEGDWGAHGVDLVPGMVVSVTDGVLTRELTLASLSIDALNPDHDTVSGTAPPNAAIDLWAWDSGSGEGASLNTNADETGSWTAHYAGVFDITAGTSVEAHVADDDGDRTRAAWRAPACAVPGWWDCSIEVSLANDWVQAWGFTADSEVTFEFFDSLGGSRLFGPETLMTDQNGHIWLDGSDHGFDLATGMAVLATDEATGTVKTLVLANTAITAIDPVSDTVTGVAPPNTTVLVGPPDPRVEVVSDGTGFWVADFSSVGFDITPELGFIANVFDEDGDSTADEISGALGQLDELTGAVGASSVRRATKTVLIGTLRIARNWLAKGKLPRAYLTLEVFVAEVRVGQALRLISVPLATSWIASARGIEAVMGY